jgi:hypothetical protein
MIIEEITQDFEDLLEKRVWAKSGSKIVRKTRCVSGPRKGRVVSSPAQCNAPKDIKKSRVMKKTRAAKGFRMARKARRTKRINPTSKRIRRLNRT